MSLAEKIFPKFNLDRFNSIDWWLKFVSLIKFKFV